MYDRRSGDGDRDAAVRDGGDARGAVRDRSDDVVVLADADAVRDLGGVGGDVPAWVADQRRLLLGPVAGERVAVRDLVHGFVLDDVHGLRGVGPGRADGVGAGSDDFGRPFPVGRTLDVGAGGDDDCSAGADFHGDGYDDGGTFDVDDVRTRPVRAVRADDAGRHRRARRDAVVGAGVRPGLPLPSLDDPDGPRDAPSGDVTVVDVLAPAAGSAPATISPLLLVLLVALAAALGVLAGSVLTVEVFS